MNVSSHFLLFGPKVYTALTLDFSSGTLKCCSETTLILIKEIEQFNQASEEERIGLINDWIETHPEREWVVEFLNGIDVPFFSTEVSLNKMMFGHMFNINDYTPLLQVDMETKQIE
jgi:hypothetical protein